MEGLIEPLGEFDNSADAFKFAIESGWLEEPQKVQVRVLHPFSFWIIEPFDDCKCFGIVERPAPSDVSTDG